MGKNLVRSWRETYAIVRKLSGVKEASANGQTVIEPFVGDCEERLVEAFKSTGTPSAFRRDNVRDVCR